MQGGYHRSFPTSSLDEGGPRLGEVHDDPALPTRIVFFFSAMRAMRISWKKTADGRPAAGLGFAATGYPACTLKKYPRRGPEGSQGRLTNVKQEETEDLVNSMVLMFGVFTFPSRKQ